MEKKERERDWGWGGQLGIESEPEEEAAVLGENFKVH